VGSAIPSYRTAGPPGAPGVLLLHGLGASSAIWDAVATQLAERGHRAFIPDLLGFGNSLKLGDDYGLRRADGSGRPKASRSRRRRDERLRDLGAPRAAQHTVVKAEAERLLRDLDRLIVET